MAKEEQNINQETPELLEDSLSKTEVLLDDNKDLISKVVIAEQLSLEDISFIIIGSLNLLSKLLLKKFGQLKSCLNKIQFKKQLVSLSI